MNPEDQHIAESYDPWTDSEDDSTSEYREASLRYLQVITGALQFVAESPSPHVAAWSVVAALGLPSMEGRSLTDISNMLGVSVQALSKSMKQFQQQTGIQPSSYQYKK